ncbi:olfactory receptor 5D13-like [Arvicola amphibius]|uniref:olfactory receptor 5D13-like n=1 Tax=Arvicola amphibius TaxID=1047088 RepID=UPI0018E3A108|nr:olfactory receptor 5D13-like [Arvicola amphibius]
MNALILKSVTFYVQMALEIKLFVVLYKHFSPCLFNCVGFSIFLFYLRDQENQTTSVTFILLDFSEYPDLQVPLFLLFLTIYSVTVLGNLGTIAIIRVNTKIRNTPMYFFLAHLSFVDFCYSTVVTPKLLENLILEDRTISFAGCIMQFFFACTFVVTETYMLAVMAYDLFVAACNLRYTVAVSPELCSFLVGASYSWGLICSTTLIYFSLRLSFQGVNILNNFVCEHAAIVAVSHSDPYISQEIVSVSATFNEMSSLIIILTSCIFVFIAAMKMPSTGGRRKAFSTCASHLTAIMIFHGTILFLYCVPNTKSSWLMVKVASVFYTVFIPMLNPLIYSLRNKDVKETIRKLSSSQSPLHPYFLDCK